MRWAVRATTTSMAKMAQTRCRAGGRDYVDGARGADRMLGGGGSDWLLEGPLDEVQKTPTRPETATTLSLPTMCLRYRTCCLAVMVSTGLW